ncbi:MAG: hypothetical protein K2Q26_10650 [Bdellovibrionales bacterium]|nr:hypothetical protein [Bdellovibrionales bacterium]
MTPKINKILLAVLTFTLFRCTTEIVPPSKYEKEIESWSQGEIEYSGFNNNFKFKATIMNESVQNAYNDRRFEIYKWDETTRQEELRKLQENNSKATTVFMSFFTPLRSDDNLSNAKSIWKIYLATPNGRYEGKTMRSKMSPTELYVLFPYHNRWATAYEVTFPVSLQEAQTHEATFIVTGPMGTKEVKFPPRH